MKRPFLVAAVVVAALVGAATLIPACGGGGGRDWDLANSRRSHPYRLVDSDGAAAHADVAPAHTYGCP